MSLTDLSGKSFVKNLFRKIVDPGVCSGCAACLLACPVDALAYQDDKPRLLDNCIDCVLCSTACPRLGLTLDTEAKKRDGASLEIGPYLRIVAGRAGAAAIRAASQDGGLVTALLAWALENQLIEGAVVSRRPEAQPWYPRPALATTVADLIASAGSSYTYSPNPLALREAAKRGIGKLGFVGPGCQVSALRQLQGAKSKKLKAIGTPVALAIGLLCSETFERVPFVEGQIAQGLGVDLRDVQKVNIKGRVLVTLRSGEVRSIPLKVVRPLARQGCHYCRDFGAEQADVSAGGLGLDGWTIVTIRTQAGEEYVSAAAKDGFLELKPADEFGAAIDLYRRLAQQQRERPAGV